MVVDNYEKIKQRYVRDGIADDGTRIDDLQEALRNVEKQERARKLARDYDHDVLLQAAAYGLRPKTEDKTDELLTDNDESR